MPSPRLTAAALLGTAVLAAGCATTVTGTATSADPPVTAPDPAVPAPPSVELPAPDDELRVSDIEATPDGGFVVLLVADWGDELPTDFVRLAPGDGGLTVGAVSETTLFGETSDLAVAPDGTVVTLGSVPPEADDPGLDGTAEPGLVLAVLAPGSDEPELRVVTADPALGSPVSGNGVLSADGATLYATVRWVVDGATVTRVAAVDVATGAVTATAPLGVETPGEAHAFDVAVLPDGGVAVLVTADRDAEQLVDHTLVVRFDADLRPAGAPVELVPDAPSAGYHLAALPDGTIVASVSVPAEDGDASRLVSVRDGAVVATADLPGAALEIAVAPGGGQVFVSYHGGAVRGEGVVALATVDLASGEVVDDVFLCPDGYSTPIAVAADGQAVAVTAACYEDGVRFSRAFLVA